MTGPYLNDKGFEVPDNKIVIVPDQIGTDGFYKDIIVPMKGNPKRDWFDPHFYYCLPLNIGNQYGFVIKSTKDFDVDWSGGDNDIKITPLDVKSTEPPKQVIKGGFRHGILTIQNLFAIKTPPGVNIMTIQPPNMFIPGCAAMTGVIETDQIRRDFTFNLKLTVPGYTVKIRKGDPLGAFIPVPRYFVDKFDLALVTDLFDEQLHINEVAESKRMGKERETVDTYKPHGSGRRYFNGIYTDESKYPDHQKRMSPGNEDIDV